jgi:hypothetical protein
MMSLQTLVDTASTAQRHQARRELIVQGAMANVQVSTCNIDPKIYAF